MYSFGSTPSVPWVPTREEVLTYLLELLRPRIGDIIYELGCGDARVASALARRFPGVKVKCVELRKDLVKRAQETITKMGNPPNIEVIEGDFFQIPVKDATIIYMYLLTSVNQKLRSKLEEELSHGTVVVSLDFPMPGWTPVASIELPRSWQRTFYVYIVGYSDKGLSDKEALRKGLSRLNLGRLPPGVKVYREAGWS